MNSILFIILLFIVVVLAGFILTYCIRKVKNGQADR